MDSERKEEQRRTSTEKILQATYEVVTDSATEDAIGSERVHAFKHIVEDMFYIPDVIDGKAFKPKAVTNPNALPVFSMYPEEELLIDPSLLGFLPEQEQELRAYLELQKSEHSVKNSSYVDLWMENILSKQLAQHSSPWTIESNAYGSVISPITSMLLPDNNPDQLLKSHNIYGRPNTMFNVKTSEEKGAGFTGLHELTHIHQFMNRTFMPEFKSKKRRKRIAEHDLRMLRDELEAYDVQVLAQRALFFNSRNSYNRFNYDLAPSEFLFYVDYLRIEANKDVLESDPYRPSVELHAEIAKTLNTALISGRGVKKVLKRHEKAKEKAERLAS